MTTTIIGFPRIGAHRELKFATEQYWKQAISQDELLKTAASLKKSIGRQRLPCLKILGQQFPRSDDVSNSYKKTPNRHIWTIQGFYKWLKCDSFCFI